MQEISRDIYLKRLIERRNVPLIKIVTGIRRCGKSYLLDPIFKNYLLSEGVPADHIIKINLETNENDYLRDPKVLTRYIKGCIRDSGQYYALLDEIQLVPDFEGVLSGFLAIDNLDTYVTGSNSKFLSSDIITEFRGRSDEIHMYPLSFKEFFSAYDGDKYEAWQDYVTYGGLPLTLTYSDSTSKMDYLISLQKNIYLKDIVDRYNIRNTAALESLIETIASSAGSLTNPYNIENTFKSVLKVNLSHNTIDGYLNKLEEAYIIEKAKRYDVKGRQYIGTPQKYYFTDVGLRNSFLGFRQDDEGHIMENIVYNELRMRGYQVDVGVVKTRDGDGELQLEIDFVANRGDRRYYIQSALQMDTRKKRESEAKSLRSVNDFFKKIIVTKDLTRPAREEKGIVTMNILDFLLNEDSLEREM